LVVKGTIYHV